MKPTTAAIVLALVTRGFASPIGVGRARMCNVAPTAGGNAQPISQPNTATADACQRACEQNTACQSYVFGLPATVSAPLCKLFSVPAAQAPAQGANLHVFDKACAGVPATQPTHAQPIGTASNPGAPKQQPRATGQPVQPPQPSPPPPKAGPPKASPKPAPAPVPQPKSPAPQPKGGTRDDASGQAPVQPDINSASQKAPAASTLPAPSRVCGAAPTGPAASATSPFRPDASVTNQVDCLALCHQPDSCKS